MKEVIDSKIVAALALFGAICLSVLAMAHADEKEVSEWPELQTFLCHSMNENDKSDWYEAYELKDPRVSRPGSGINDSIEDVSAFPLIRIEF
jgi:hypothetical protein